MGRIEQQIEDKKFQLQQLQERIARATNAINKIEAFAPPVAPLGGHIPVVKRRNASVRKPRENIPTLVFGSQPMLGFK